MLKVRHWLALAAPLAALVPPARKVTSGRRARKATQRLDPSAILAPSVKPARKAQPVQQVRKAVPRISLPAQLALAAKQDQQARSEQRARKALSERRPAGPYTGTSVSVTTARTFRLLV